ncbi:uncharacterized protein LOC108462817 [Gossypium arboreum]|uniref:uncharacterized protein LOC108462817 n=1 Tax=Gossypium arboreum TaxID=29729 RepID=UPI00081909BB|nr:uncharacterized protein LOC108462817 [Gossypium arboreum]
MVENQSDYKLKMVKLDNRVEYTTEKFEKFCEEAGFHYQLSNVYPPQQNGTAAEEEMYEQRSLRPNLQTTRNQTENDEVYEQPVRGIRSITKIYQQCNLAKLEPLTFEEAAQEAEWRTATKDYITMINKNETLKLVDRPIHKKVIGVNWLFRMKMKPDGSINRYKARLVVKGFTSNIEWTSLKPLPLLRG